MRRTIIVTDLDDFEMPTVIQTWYIAIDVNDNMVAMFLERADCVKYCKEKETEKGLPYTQDEYKMILKQ